MESESQNLVKSSAAQFLIQSQLVQDLVTGVLEYLHLQSTQVEISFVEDEEIKTMNRDFRGKDSPTDVLSFPQMEWQEPITQHHKNPLRLVKGEFVHSPGQTLLGDLVIAPEYAEKNASSLGQSLSREIAFLITHGILHLCGHDHQTEDQEELMTGEQRNIMSRLETLQDEKPIWEDMVLRKAAS